MAQSFNTGTTAGSGGSTATSQAITIPAGVLAGDAILVVAFAFANTNGATITATSTGTTPVSLQQVQCPSFSSSTGIGGLWLVEAGASDAGKVITLTLSTGTAFWSVALGAWTGFAASPVDVSGQASAAGVADINSPAETTGVGGAWAIYAAAVADVNNALNNPAGTTQREKLITASGIAAALVDSNGSVGGAGTGIGGASVQWAATTTTAWLTAFTVSLAPPVAGSGALLAGSPP